MLFTIGTGSRGFKIKVIFQESRNGILIKEFLETAKQLLTTLIETYSTKKTEKICIFVKELFSVSQLHCC